jgi:hypothetical protein
MTNLPIADYALLSDCRSESIVSREGSVDWLCFPRFDGPSVFARLLDADAGHWSLRAPDATDVSRRYLEGTMVLETTFRTPTGTAVPVDRHGGRPQREGPRAGHRVARGPLRRLTCTSGRVRFELEFAPRPEYGLVHPLLSEIPGGLLARGGADVLVLSTPVEVATGGSTATAIFRLDEGQQLGFALQHQSSSEPPSRPWSRRRSRRGWSRRSGDGAPGPTSTRATPDPGGSGCTTAGESCRHSPSSRPAPWWPRRRLPSRSRWRRAATARRKCRRTSSTWVSSSATR